MEAVVMATAAAGSVPMSAKTESGQSSIATIVEQLAERVDHLEDRVDDLEQENADLEQENADLEDRVADLEEQTARSRAEDRQRLTDAEDRLDDLEEGETPTSDPTPETGLEQLSRLPDELLEDESANVQRSVALAESWRDHASKAPVGFVLSSGELARVLRDETDCRGHSQTAARVIDRLDKLGGEAVSVVERRGERRVALEPELVGRLEDLGESPTAANHGVVSEGVV